MNSCLDTGKVAADDETDDWLRRSGQVGRYIACGADARGLDRGKCEKAVAALKPGLSQRVALGTTFGWAYESGHRMTVGYKAMAAKDPDFKKILFDAPEAGVKEWTKEYQTHKAAVEDAYDWEQKYADNLVRKSQLKATVSKCAPPLRKSFVGYLESTKPKVTSDVIKAATGPVGYPILSALVAREFAIGYYALGKGLDTIRSCAARAPG